MMHLWVFTVYFQFFYMFEIFLNEMLEKNRALNNNEMNQMRVR